MFENFENKEKIFKVVINVLAEGEVDLPQIVSVTSNGGRSTAGLENGFVSLFSNRVGHLIKGFHCIIHEQISCEKSSFKSQEDVTNLFTKLVKFISARGSNKRKFSELLKQVNSAYSALLVYNNVRWLSWGKVFGDL